MGNITIYLIALSLSMDAFSLALAYGTLNLCKKDIIKLSILVGLYHFIMPIIGLKLGNIIQKTIPINPNIIVFLVLIFIGFEMIIDSKKSKEEVKVMNHIEMFLFGLAISIDSFSVGIGLKLLTKNIPYALFVFSITSLTFTYIGLYQGKRISNKIGKNVTLVGGILLILVGISYLVK